MPSADIVQLIAVAAIPVLLAVTFHEVAHGLVARSLGDRTAEMTGRLSLNPLKHVDPIGTVLVPAIFLATTQMLFGWAKPVPIGVRNFKNPRRDMVLVAAAGPASNLVMAVIWALIGKVVAMAGLGGAVGAFIAGMVWFGIFINVILAVFNMLPIPPLDGGRVLSGLLPPRASSRLDAVEPYGLVIVLVLLFTGVLWRIVGPAVQSLGGALRAFAGF